MAKNAAAVERSVVGVPCAGEEKTRIGAAREDVFAGDCGSCLPLLLRVPSRRTELECG